MAARFQVDTNGTLLTSLVSYYKLENTDDYYGSNSLTNTNSVAFVSGKVNNCADFNGSSNRLSASLLSNSVSNISLFMWVYLSSNSMKGAFAHMGRDHATSPDGYVLGVGSGDMDTNGNHLIGLLSTVGWMDFGTNIGTGWHFVGLVNDSGTWKGYIDNSLCANTFANPPYTPVTPTGNFWLGVEAPSAGTPRYFADQVDECGFWTKVLSAQEKTDLYNSGSGQTMITSTNYTKTFTDDSFTISEPSFVKATSRTWAELITLTETFTRALTKTFTETALTLSETISQQKGKSLSDLVTITDLGIGRAFTRVYSEISNITDSISKAITKSLTDFISVSPNPIVDSYSESNFSGGAVVDASLERGQSFTGKDGVLNTIQFQCMRYGTPTGNVVVKVYSHSGVYGVSSIGNTLLATSEVVDITTIPTFYTLISFLFTGANKISLVTGTYYVITITSTAGGWPNCLSIGWDATSPNHSGNYLSYNGAIWDYAPAFDLPFYVYSDGGGDTLSKIKGYVRTLSDELSVIDLGIGRAFTKIYNETIDLTETFVKATVKVFNEVAVAITEVYLSTRAKIFNEVITLSEIFSKIYGRFVTFTETEITISDAFVKLKGKNFFDTISITETIQKLWDRIASGIPSIFSARDAEKATGRTSALDKPQGLTNTTIEAMGNTKAVDKPIGIVKDTDKPVKV